MNHQCGSRSADHAIRLPAALALCLAVSCGGSNKNSEVDVNGAGSGNDQGGSVALLVSSGGSDTGSGGSAGAVSSLPPGTLPAGFTKTELGGYELGAQLAVGGAASGGASSAGASAGGAAGCGSTILAVIRDFKADGVTFEGPTGDDRGVVETTLGTDRKPVYAKSGPTHTIGGAAVFDEFYRDTPGVNIPFTLEIFFAPNNGVTSFQSNAFFPLDGKGWGDDGKDAAGNPHNFHFTTEIHTQFLYSGGETFNFTGDDDVWLFLNNQLVIDLGGVHNAENASVVLDKQASMLGLKVGSTYPFDLFYNERHTVASDFRADTDLAFVDCGTIVPEPSVK